MRAPNVPSAAAAAVRAWFGNTGQDCISAKRFLSTADNVLPAWKWLGHRKLLGQIIVRHMCAEGDPLNPRPSLLAEVAADHVLELVEVDYRVRIERVDVVDGHQP